MDKKEIQKTVLNAYNFRHACKLFDKNKKIPDEDINYILETGRLSPTSFGMQGVRLLVIADPEIKKEVKKACWNQPQIDTCSHLVVFLTRTEDLVPGSNWVESRFKDRGMSAENQKAYYDKYDSFHKDLKSRIEGYFKRKIPSVFYSLFHKQREPKDIYQWGARQAYILLGNMMTGASMIEIDSCPIEGFSKNDVEKILNINTEKEEVAVLCTFGYRVNEQSEKRRLQMEEIAEFR